MDSNFFYKTFVDLFLTKSTTTTTTVMGFDIIEINLVLSISLPHSACFSLQDGATEWHYSLTYTNHLQTANKLFLSMLFWCPQPNKLRAVCVPTPINCSPHQQSMCGVPTPIVCFFLCGSPTLQKNVVLCLCHTQLWLGF